MKNGYLDVVAPSSLFFKQSLETPNSGGYLDISLGIIFPKFQVKIIFIFSDKTFLKRSSFLSPSLLYNFIQKYELCPNISGKLAKTT